MRKEKLQKHTQKEKRLTIDLRSGCDFKKSSLKPGFKFVLIGYYALMSFLLVGVIYAIAKIAIVKKEAESIKSEDIRLTTQIRELQELSEKTALKIEKANKLIEWQLGDIHVQRLLHALFSKLSKEVLLEKFSLKQDHKNDHELSLEVVFKGGYPEIHEEFKSVISKLEGLGLMLISQNQSEIHGGMRFNLVCQTNALLLKTHQE